MGDIEFLVVLLAAATVGVRLADRAHIPYPIVLVLFGLAIGLVPGLPDLRLDPDVVFLVFLPPLLHAAGWVASPRELRTEVRPLAALAVGLVLLTMVAVAVVAHAIVPGMSWPAAFVLGAIVAPTDPVSATATFSRIGVPDRVRRLVAGEAMINDGSALVAYRVALTAALEGTFSPAGAALEFVVAAAGGVLVGLAVGWAATEIVRRQDDVPLTIFVTLLSAYGGYIIAEELHVSGVLGAVVAGIYSGWRSPESLGADMRLTGLAFWGVMTFGLEALLFVLLGLQAPQLASEIDVAPLTLQALVVSLVVIAVRMAWALLPVVGAGDDLKERIAVGWSGMRGAISLAAALAVSTQVDERPEILLITFGVILVTLVGQGLTLPLVLRALRLPGENRWSPDEALARLETAQAALDRIEELEDAGAAEEPLRRLREHYRARFELCVAALEGADGDRTRGMPELSRYADLRRDLIGVERRALLDMRASNRVSPQVLRRVQRDLDLDEARLRG
ncbi:MAG TPA: Na+/H+ antiporter [Solirubrobacteraceae bacterium]|nr:Na+/H+ antiporter [Solirubrobacteraceae bacterium]